MSELVLRALFGNNPCVTIPPNSQIVLGRYDLGIENELRVSRQHIVISWEKTAILVSSNGRNPCWIKRESGIPVFLNSQPVRYHKGDILYIIPGHDYPYKLEERPIDLHVSNNKKRIRQKTHTTELPPSKRQKFSLYNSNEENIQKIMEIVQCDPATAEQALQAANGQLDIAIAHLLDTQNGSHSIKISNSKNISSSNCFYPNYIPSCVRNYNAMRITDIVEGDIKEAILCTYMLDVDWLLDQLPVLCIIPTVISHGQKDLRVLCSLPPNFKLVMPRMPLAYGCNHGKLFVLFYDDKVRIAVSTANLLQCDYERKSQGIWYQDFYRKTTNSSTGSDFEYTLADYLRKQNLVPQLFSLSKFDFSTAKVALITSVPGYHKGGALYLYGHMKVRKFLSNLSLKPPIDIICQFSSVGSLTQNWVQNELQDSFTGNYSQSAHACTLKMLWPSNEFVGNSIDGYNAGGSLCLPSKNYTGKSFLQEYFYTYRASSTRRHIPPHIKTYFAYATSDPKNLSWLLLTSANMSKAAWGQLQQRDTQLMIRHFEIGVLFLPKEVPFINGVVPGENNDRITFALPYEYERLDKFSSFTDKLHQPWMWDVDPPSICPTIDLS